MGKDLKLRQARVKFIQDHGWLLDTDDIDDIKIELNKAKLYRYADYRDITDLMASSLFIEAKFGIRIPAAYDRYPARELTWERYGSFDELELGFERAMSNPRA